MNKIKLSKYYLQATDLQFITDGIAKLRSAYHNDVPSAVIATIPMCFIFVGKYR